MRAAVHAWKLEIFAEDDRMYSDTVTAVKTPQGFDASLIVSHAARKYAIAFGAGLGDVAGKVFRIGHLGSMTDVMVLSGIAAAEMTMADLGLEVRLGAGVSAAQELFRNKDIAAFRQAQ